MPIVQPEYRGSTHTLTLAVESELLLRTLAYSKLCNATVDSVIKVALTRLLEADAAEFETWLAQHKDELDPRKLRGFPTGSPRRRTSSAKARTQKTATSPTAVPQKPTPVAAAGGKA